MRRVASDVAPILLGLAACALTGCFATKIGPLMYPPEAQRVLTIPERTILLTVHAPDPQMVLGHQFVLVGLPVTGIYAPYLRRELETHLALAGAIRHYRVMPGGLGATENTPRLRVSISELSLSGYDLIFIRRPSASISLDAVLETSQGTERSCNARAEVTRTRRLAFEPQLSDVLRVALEKVTKQIFDCLHE